MGESKSHNFECTKCRKAVPATASFCPECGSPLQAVRPKSRAQPQKSKSTRAKKERKSKVEKRSAFWVRVRQEIIDAIGALSAIIVMPGIIVTLSHWIGMIAAWLAIGISVIYAVFSFWPRPFPMGSSKLKARLTCVMALVAAVAAFYFGRAADELANLKKYNVGAYLEKLREYKGDDEWLATIKELTPENYAAAVKHIEEEKAAAVEQKARQTVQEKRDKVLSDLKELAVKNAVNGQIVRSDYFPNGWTLTPARGVLRCELGPVANGAPRPLVLLDADKKTYALNGAALGTGKYEDGRSLAIDGDIQVIRDLIPIGISMCDELSKSQCGTEAWAYNYAEQAVLQRLKSPADASVSMLHASTTMKSCGIWLVKSYVDATNGFGAKVRTHFTAEMTRTSDGQWIGNVSFEQ